MKRLIVCMIVCIITLICAPEYRVYAQEETILPNEQEQLEQLLHDSGANELLDIVPDEADDFLRNNNINSLDSQEILDVSFFGFIKNIVDTVKNSLAKPSKVMLASIGVMFLCALLNSLKSGFENNSYAKTFSIVSVMCIAATMIMPIIEIITRAAAMIKQVSRFMLSFVPIYVGIISATGKPVTAVTYQMSVVSVIQVISYIATTILVPLMSMYLAFCLVGATSSHIKIDGIARGVKTVVTVVLSFLLTVFVGLLTMQGVVSSSVDTMGMKTAKFAASAFLPVVGSAISDALTSVQGCMGVMKATVGGFSIMVVVAAFLPCIISIILMQVALSVSACVGDMLDVDKISALMRSAKSVLSILLGIVLVFFILLVVSTGIMLMLIT